MNKVKLMSITVTHVDGKKEETIVWGGDDVSSLPKAAPKPVVVTSVNHPSGVKIDSIIWGS